MERRKGGFVIRMTDSPEILIRHLKLRRVTHDLRNSRRRRIGVWVEIRVRVLKMIRNERLIEIRVRVNGGEELLLLLRWWWWL